MEDVLLVFYMGVDFNGRCVVLRIKLGLLYLFGGFYVYYVRRC